MEENKKKIQIFSEIECFFEKERKNKTKIFSIYFLIFVDIFRFSKKKYRYLNFRDNMKLKHIPSKHLLAQSQQKRTKV